MHTLSLFIFRRDLRINDNTALYHALKESKRVIPCFIFDPHQVGDSNHYKSTNAIQFMVESLQDVESQLKAQDAKLYLFYGDTLKTITHILDAAPIDAVYINADYTPYAQTRDSAIEKLCTKKNIQFFTYHDALINPPETVLKKDGTPYSIFTPYYKASLTHHVAKPLSVSSSAWYTDILAGSERSSIYKKVCPENNDLIALHGGRKAGLKILKNLDNYTQYAANRDVPSAEHSTTLLSAHHKFGTISIRETYAALRETLGAHHPLIRQLYWRDFYTYIAYHTPHVFGSEYREQYQHLKWNTDTKLFEAWCAGKTGFPIVDAGMRQLNETGFMHNRVRMITASFLTKDLHIDWRMGERYFAQKLVDYDPAVNNGNWQWSSSTGCDPQPYFRIFNPWLQQKKFDPECIYIKQWIPELKNSNPKDIHRFDKPTTKRPASYPFPIIDHGKESKISIAWFKNSKR